MAFTESELNKIVMITGVDRISLNQVLSTYAVYITSEVETDVREQIALWVDDGIGTKTTKIHPTESNKGVETMPGARRGDIIKTIVRLLFLTDLVGVGSGQFATVRG